MNSDVIAVVAVGCIPVAGAALTLAFKVGALTKEVGQLHGTVREKGEVVDRLEVEVPVMSERLNQAKSLADLAVSQNAGIRDDVRTLSDLVRVALGRRPNGTGE